MKILTDLKIGRRLGISFSVILILMLVLGLTGFLSINNISKSTTRFIKNDARVAEYSAHALAGIHGMRQHEKNMIIFHKSPVFLNGYYKKWLEQYEHCQKKLNGINIIIKNTGGNELVESMLVELSKYKKGMNSVYKKMLSSEIRTINRVINVMAKYKKGIRTLEENLKDISQLYSDRMEVVDEDIKSTNIRTIIILLVIIAISIIISIILSVTITRSIEKPLYYGVDIANEISKGDLTVDVKVEGKDELNQLLSAQREVVVKVKDVILDIKNAANMMAVSSEEMTSTTGAFSDNARSQAATAEEVSATIEEISAGIDNIAQSSSDQLDMLKILLEKMGNLSVSINEMDDRVHGIILVSDHITTTAKSGEGSLNNMNNSMDKIIGSSQKMLNIVEIINDISDKINLLSLNAAIEAARAGEAGRGFAVVADEISKLADQTASSIKEIDSLVKVNNSEIEIGMGSTSEAYDTVNTILEQIGTVDDFVEDISSQMKILLTTRDEVNNSLETVRHRLEEVKKATEEQNNATSEISKSITNINELTQSNATGAEDLSGSSEEIAGMAESLRAKVDFFKV
ncbi:methyl-accepting chemotaxis protein [Spirochaetota bacterium]